MEQFLKTELKQYSKNQLIEIIIAIQQGKTDLKLPVKNSDNSSIPSSKDISKKETKNDNHKKKGPTFGHIGISRKSCENPDIVIKQKITKCPRTGKEVKFESKSFQKHQIFELFPCTIKVIEIQRQITTGPDGKTIIAPNPPGIKNNQRFGPYLKCWISSLRYQYHMEWENIRKLMKAFCQVNISEGSLNNIFNELREECESDYEKLGKNIKESDKIGADETGARINGKKAWAWIFQTDDISYYKIEDNRSHKVVEEVIGKDYKGTLVTDFFGAYSEKFFTEADFQKCIEHLKRDVIFSCEVNPENEGFSQKLFKIIIESIKIKSDFVFGGLEFIQKREEIKVKLYKLLNQNDLKLNAIENRLKKRIIKYKDHLFTFLEKENIPFDNNASERDIRKIVIFRKIYGCFRTKEGANNLEVIFSILETAKKNKEDVFQKIQNYLKVNLFKELLVNT